VADSVTAAAVAADNDEINDGGSAGMAHFVEINKASRTSMSSEPVRPACYPGQGRVSTNHIKTDTIANCRGLASYPVSARPDQGWQRLIVDNLFYRWDKRL
jgi:hypothetical protein